MKLSVSPKIILDLVHVSFLFSQCGVGDKLEKFIECSILNLCILK